MTAKRKARKSKRPKKKIYDYVPAYPYIGAGDCSVTSTGLTSSQLSSYIVRDYVGGMDPDKPEPPLPVFLCALTYFMLAAIFGFVLGWWVSP